LRSRAALSFGTISWGNDISITLITTWPWYIPGVNLPRRIVYMPLQPWYITMYPICTAAILAILKLSFCHSRHLVTSSCQAFSHYSHTPHFRIFSHLTPQHPKHDPIWYIPTISIIPTLPLHHCSFTTTPQWIPVHI
jgi:hypothetical protein